MLIGKVVDNIWASRKHDALRGHKLMVVHILDKTGKQHDSCVAIDNIGAGIGDNVLISTGSAARIVCHDINTPIDAAIVAIIDDYENKGQQT